MGHRLLLLRDSLSIITGRDYFHRPQGLGSFTEDPRCYYNDLRAKADWRGRTADGVPLLYVPGLCKDVPFPIMILQYGLGCLDRYFLTGGAVYLNGVEDVWRWILRELAERDHFRNPFPLFAPEVRFHSDNSAMAQGEALSFLCRLRRFLPARFPTERIDDLLERIHDDMTRPVQEGGTMLSTARGPAFCESCIQDGPLVLNGWIFALFGLLDLTLTLPGPGREDEYRLAERSLRRSLDDYLLPDGWSLYDDRGALASPFYQDLHLSLLEGLHLLSGHDDYARAVLRLRRGKRPLVWLRRTAAKSWQKLGSRRVQAARGAV